MADKFISGVEIVTNAREQDRVMDVLVAPIKDLLSEHGIELSLEEVRDQFVIHIMIARKNPASN